jgi:RNA polymerase sigma-70 factor (ECF subfamily)
LELTATIVQDELVERCKRGDPTGFEALYQRYARAMYNTSLRIVNNTGDAEDVLQEAFLDAFRSLNDFHYRSTFGAWLKRIVINKSINILRKKKMHLSELDENGVEAIPDEKGIDEAELQFKVAEIKKYIQLLPDGYRAVLSLYLLEGYDHEEISGILGITHNTVRTQYVRAKQKLLNLLKQGGLS